MIKQNLFGSGFASRKSGYLETLIGHVLGQHFAKFSVVFDNVETGLVRHGDLVFTVYPSRNKRPILTENIISKTNISVCFCQKTECLSK
ncbi:Uncharacterised protein [Vibrio cholerae]|uniref:Uncharacterized protein n=1 Tax=Vibrio cholerae TaxID=666 RepID=A0A655Q9E7_VIBCL|nr:Uncharacterised protein [Vibrio cholerae]CSA45130.1 Uncharacterised protein [Vibrio cholerae]CSB62693.1 Uncharacterised protein [Vibrio cholerae]CSB65652.1 Uncharacterised protein [Vibrio cholerae]CSC17725.1 Uncharacterised protein [Vibrio cholerae]